MKYLMIFIFLSVSAISFAADSEPSPGGGSGSGTGLVDCIYNCQTEHSRCELRAAEFLCNLQAMACLASCPVGGVTAMARAPISFPVTIKRDINKKHLDGYENNTEDYAVMTRYDNRSTTQTWLMKPVGENEFVIQQASTLRYLDAYDYAGSGFRAVTRPKQNNSSQRWKVRDIGAGRYTIQQVSSNRYLSAVGTRASDYSVVTRSNQHMVSQAWRIETDTSFDFDAVLDSRINIGIDTRPIFDFEAN